MTFVIRRIEQGDLDRIYPDSEADQISKFTYAKRTFPAVERGMNWAVNDKSNAFLMMVPESREGYVWRYLFGCENGLAILKFEKYCLYSFIFISESLLPQIEEAKSLIREAFKVAGTMIDKEMAKDEVFAVPDAQFIGEGEQA